VLAALLTLAIAGAPASAESVFVASSRGADKPGTTSAYVSESLRFSIYEVSFPASRRIGSTAGAVVEASTAVSARRFAHEVIDAGGGEVVVYVHGYNTSFQTSLARTAELGEDWNLGAPIVLFAWPSLRVLSGYDRDVARAEKAERRLVDLLTTLADAGATRVVLMGHSLGAKLAMEALAGMTVNQRQQVLPRLGGIVLLSPDMSVDALNAALAAMPGLQSPLVAFLSRDDLALKTLSLLGDRKERVGVVSSPSAVRGAKAYLVDVSNVSSIGFGHFAVATQPALIDRLNAMPAPDLVRFGRELASGAIPGTVISTHGTTIMAVLPRMR
jgi:esterase/lipase superfamily enzyme